MIRFTGALFIWSTMSEPIRLTAAVAATRDALRARIMPGLEKLSSLVGSNPEAEALIRQIHAEAWKHADALRFAMKARTVRPIRSNNPPCWSPTKPAA